jgi:hypothetical protein
MKRRLSRVFAGACVLAMFTLWVLPVGAQMSEVKEKPPMYTYVANWTIPRAQWAEMDKSEAADQPILDKALTDGTIIGYGSDITLVHTPDGGTHDDWWSSMSMGGLIKVLDQFYKSGNSVSPVLESATKHWDGMYVSRYYHWTSGSWKDAYTYVAIYKLKPDAPDNAVDLLSKDIVAPLMEKLLADGTLHEYEIDTQALHTHDPNFFFIVYVAAHPDGLDKVDAAIDQSLKAHPLEGPTFGSMVDFSAHRDELAQSTLTYK